MKNQTSKTHIGRISYHWKHLSKLTLIAGSAKLPRIHRGTLVLVPKGLAHDVSLQVLTDR
jgi:hypothetical protein